MHGGAVLAGTRDWKAHLHGRNSAGETSIGGRCRGVKLRGRPAGSSRPQKRCRLESTSDHVHRQGFWPGIPHTGSPGPPTPPCTPLTTDGVRRQELRF